MLFFKNYYSQLSRRKADQVENFQVKKTTSNLEIIWLTAFKIKTGKKTPLLF